MKKNLYPIPTWIISLFWLLSTGSLCGQCYIPLQDASGVSSVQYQGTMEAAACSLSNTVLPPVPPATVSQFKVYTAGFYLHQESYDLFSYPAAFDTLKTRVSQMSEYYILIAWQNDPKGLYTDYYLDVKFPDVSGNGCDIEINEMVKAFLSMKIDKGKATYGNTVGGRFAAMEEGIRDLKVYIQDIKACCTVGGDIEKCVTCKSQDNQKAFLKAEGFRPVPISNIHFSGAVLPYEADEIENKAQHLLFKSEDLEDVEIGHKYKPVIDTYHVHGMTIKVIVTHNENLCSLVWDTLAELAQSGAFDVVYWHHIFKEGEQGNGILFTKAFIKGAGNNRLDKFGNRVATNVVAALGAAATDFLFQVAVHYIFDDDVESGEFGKAVSRVDYWEVTKSGIVGLFGVNEKVAAIGNALAHATVKTVKLADWYSQPQHAPDPLEFPDGYTLRWAAKDFNTFFLENLVEEGLGLLVGGAAGKIIGKAKQIPFPGWCKIARLLNKRLGTMIPGCFAAGTLVLTPTGKVPIEQLSPGDWVFADVGLSPHQFAKANAEDVDIWAAAGSSATPQTHRAPSSKTLDIPLFPEYDFEDITPESWSVATLEVLKTDGTLAEVRLLRPNQWLETQDLRQVGDSTWLDLPEMRVSGMARMVAIQPATTDTRSSGARALLEQGYFPVLAAFRHKADEVLNLRFTNGDRIRTTAPHPFWSLDRNGWLAAEKLHHGERIKTAAGETMVDTMWLDFGATEVFNLEVKEVHSFCVGDLRAFSHNACSTGEQIKIAVQAFVQSKLPKSTQRFIVQKHFWEDLFEELDDV